MMIGKSFEVFFYPHLHINCVAPPCFRARHDKAFASKKVKNNKTFAYIIYKHFTQQCRSKKKYFPLDSKKNHTFRNTTVSNKNAL